VRKWKGKLDLLPGIPKPHMAGMDEFKGDDARTMEIFGEIVREARGFYDFRVIDVGPDFNQPLHWAAIQEANTVLLVVTPEKTAILDIANILPALAKHFGSLQKFRLVLNQFDERFGLDAKQVVAFLNGQVTILGSVPYAPVEARQSINQGEPVVLQKTLIPMAEAIVKLGGKFYPPLEQLGRKRPVAKRPGLFQRTKETFAS
jgi:MinD-like ATPase involved in chromosome partitioning or flagellar assembly